jgi:hypothetical protein
MEKIKYCKCGYWHNTSIKCPTCGTLAEDKYNPFVPTYQDQFLIKKTKKVKK